MDPKQTPFFSIIIPTYNRSHLVGRTIESVISQTYENWELIIVDGGDQPIGKELFDQYNDKRIQQYLFEGKGVSAARNFGIDLSKGEYLCFLDDDDYYLASFLESFFKKIETERDFSGMIFCNEYTEINRTLYKGRFIDPGQETNLIKFLWEERTSVRPMIFRAEVFNNIRFNTRYELNEDFDLAIRVALDYKLDYVPKLLCVYVQHEDQISKRKFDEEFQMRSIQAIQCIRNLIMERYIDLVQHIPVTVLYDQLNHKVYGFASNAMKKGKIKLFFTILRYLSFKGTSYKYLYYSISLFSRFIFYLFFGFINKKYKG